MTDMFDEIDCHYRIIMEELRHGSYFIIEEDNGATTTNYLHQVWVTGQCNFYSSNYLFWIYRFPTHIVYVGKMKQNWS